MYYDYRYRAASRPWTEVLDTGLEKTSVNIVGLAPGNLYQVQVRAVSEAGTSEWSESGSARTKIPPTPTPVPDYIASTKRAVVKVQAGTSTGSGFVVDVDGQRGLVLTNYHVIDSSLNNVKVSVGSTSYNASVLGYDGKKDVAMLQICCSSSFNYVSLGYSNPRTGLDVVAIGYPLRSSTTVATRGIVSRTFFDSDYEAHVVQTDAPINPGNSGGPLVSLSNGEVVGITTSIIRETGGISVEGHGFAVSSSTIVTILDDLESGALKHAPEPTPTPRPTSAWRNSVFDDGDPYVYVRDTVSDSWFIMSCNNKSDFTMYIHWRDGYLPGQPSGSYEVDGNRYTIRWSGSTNDKAAFVPRSQETRFLSRIRTGTVLRVEADGYRGTYAIRGMEEALRRLPCSP